MIEDPRFKFPASETIAFVALSKDNCLVIFLTKIITNLSKKTHEWNPRFKFPASEIISIYYRKIIF